MKVQMISCLDRLGARLNRRWFAGLMLGLVGFAGVPSVEAAGVTVTDPADMLDSSGDIRSIQAAVLGEDLVLTMSVQGVAGPGTEQTGEGMANRYYYHWLLDTDNNLATGRSNAEYEGNPTGVVAPIGADRIIQIGWRDGLPDGVYAYDPADDETELVSGFAYQVGGNSLRAVIPLAELGLVAGQTIAVSAFQEGQSDGWSVDWVESGVMTLSGPATSSARVSDPVDMADSSGDIRAIEVHVLGEDLVLSMTVEGVVAPAVEQTPEGMNNRYYYHWLLDTDNNPATGRSNAEYEGTPTGVATPIGADRIIQIGWRDGVPNGVYAYDPADDETALVPGFTFLAGGNTLRAVIPLAGLGLAQGQTIAVSAFQEGQSDGWSVDWMESETVVMNGPAGPRALVEDPADMLDTSGDIRSVDVHVMGEDLVLSMTVEGVAGPALDQTPEGMSNRYYYHWLLDTDNNPATGRSNAEYEGSPTGVARPIGADRIIQIGWRDGRPDGIYGYDPADDETELVSDFIYQAGGNTLRAVIPLADLGLVVGQTIAVSAFQEGQSDGWSVDWVESATLVLEPLRSERMAIDGDFGDWEDAADGGAVVQVDDPQDMADSSGDLRMIQATVENNFLYLRMTVQGIALPSAEETPEGMANRYYYHWLLDTDNNPATGRSNAEYEGTPTGVTTPIGADLIIQIGWRAGAPDGVYVYDPADDETEIVTDFEFKQGGDSLEARLALADLGLVLGQTIAVSAFQEGQSDGWSVDWLESVQMTLVESGAGGLDLENRFAGNAYGFEITVTDSAEMAVDTDSVVVEVDGEAVDVTVAKEGGVTTVAGLNPSLFEAGTSHRVSLRVEAGGVPQSEDYTLVVKPYTVLPTEDAVQVIDTSNRGFVANITAIWEWQSGATSVHSNLAELAEVQLTGGFTDEQGNPYINEAFPNDTTWRMEPEVVTGPINWYELAPAEQHHINFTNDVAIPLLSGQGFAVDGLAVELVTYLQLTAGYHTFGLFTEGGYKATAGLSPDGPVLGLFDNTDAQRVPTYFARNQLFDVVALEPGYYPIRILWFQSHSSQELGAMLEFASVSGQTLHLVNDISDPESIPAYRAGPLVGSGGTPMVQMQISGGALSLQWQGQLQMAERLTGPWVGVAYEDESPMTVDTQESGGRFYRAKSY